MQKEIRRFVEDIKTNVKKSPHKSKIISIVLLGSAARGEWIKGESDVDIIIVVKQNKYKDEVTGFFGNLLNRLNKKHKLDLEETTTVGKKHNNALINGIMKAEAFVFFGVPFYVVSLDDYDFFRNKIKDPRVWFLATFLGSINTFLISVKNTAKVIYGKDILKQIHVKITFFDRFMVNLEQFYIILASLLILPFDQKMALKHAMKATIYQEELDLLFIGKHTRGYLKDQKLFDKIFIGSRFLKNHLRKTLYYRVNFKKIDLSKKEVSDYIWSTVTFLKENNRELDRLLVR